MPAKCPGCGATGAPEARFCRRCGAPLKASGGQDTAPQVSPVAQTVPLADEGRATDGLAAEESQRLGEGTSRIKRAEMDELLRRIARDHGDSVTRDGGGDSHGLTSGRDGDSLSATPALVADGDDSSQAAPVTSGLKPEHSESAGLPQTESGVAAQAESGGAPHTETVGSGAPPAQALSKERSGFKWRWAAAVLLCVALGAGVLAVIYMRRPKASVESSASAPSSEEPPPVAAQTGEPQSEPSTVESPPTASSPAQAPMTTREKEAAAHPSGPASPALASVSPAAQPQPVPSPDARPKTPQPPTPPALSPTERYQRGVQLWATDRRAALEEFRRAVPAVPDAYYYLGSEYYPEGRDAKTLSDGELRAALNYFLRATAGPHSGQASRSAQLLGKEYERRKKKQSRP